MPTIIYHKHHIVPKHMTNGIYDNSPDNLTPPISVALHAALHKDLYDHFGLDGDFMAWNMLLGKSFKDYKLSPETCQKLSKAGIGNQNRKGKKDSEETKRKKSLSHQGKKQGPNSKEHNKKISNSLKGNQNWKGASY